MPAKPEANGRRSRSAADLEQVYPSTTWEWKTVRIRTPAGGQQASPPKAGRWYRLPPWSRRKKLTIVVRYRGGSACWYEVKARGAMGRFQGVTALHDVMSEIYNAR